ncbi:MAG: hypothetical protein U0353_15020 [Sandaracinus sp.]
MSVEERHIRDVIRTVRPSSDHTARELCVATLGAMERALGRSLEAHEVREVERVVSRWFSERCMAEALDELEAEERATEARRRHGG